MTTVAVTHLPFTNSGGAPSPLHHRGCVGVPWPVPHGGGTHQVAISIPMVAVPLGVAHHHEHNAVTPHGLYDGGGRCQAFRRFISYMDLF